MEFGLQKMTLLDYPGKVACTVFTGGCNFRCPFCHNPELVHGGTAPSGMMPEEEILQFLKKRSGLLDGVCITGGEPLIHAGLPDFIAKVRELGFLVKLDTNGSFPEKLRALLDAGLLDYVAMDIKNAPAKYAATAGCEALEQVEKSVEILRNCRIPFEFRTTVTGNLHEAADFTAIGRWLGGVERYFLQPFLDSGEVLKPDAGYPVSAAKMQACLAAVQVFIPGAVIRGK